MLEILVFYLLAVMALITIVGFPCSGKSRLAEALVKDLKAHLSHPDYSGPNLDVVLVSDDTSHVSRSVYDNSIAEKPGRGNLFTNVTRALGPDKIVVCDSLNYIKGFRYQMYCAAREAHARTVTVHVATPPKKCEEWHENRGECSYKPATFENLLMRFEEPSSMVRWDSPLITVAWDEPYPLDAIWECATSGEKKGPSASVRPRAQPAPNTLQTLTKTTALINSSLLSHINAAPSSSTFPIPSPPAPSPGSIILHLPMRRVTLPEMQRLKRQFEATHTRAQASGGMAGGIKGETEVATAYVGFLETAWDTAE